jgi:CRISPR-associated protein Csb2
MCTQIATNAAGDVSAPPLMGDAVVFDVVGGPPFPATRAVEVAEALRGALMRHAPQPPHPVLSGHRSSGAALDTPHALFIPLPSPHAPDGVATIVALAVLVPVGSDEHGRHHLHAAVERWEHCVAPAPCALTFGRDGALLLRRARPAATLLPGALLPWCDPARRFCSVTPVALDRNPGNLWSRHPTTAARARAKAIESLSAGCRRLGFPPPAEVHLSAAALFPGAAAAHHFGPFPRQAGKFRRVLTHATFHFAQPVQGPLLLGAGRFRGLGLFQPAPSLVPGAATNLAPLRQEEIHDPN